MSHSHYQKVCSVCKKMIEQCRCWNKNKVIIYVIVCPCTKEPCILYDISSSGREWCDDEGDPSTFERCPIPKKRKEKTEAFIKEKIDEKKTHSDSLRDCINHLKKGFAEAGSKDI